MKRFSIGSLSAIALLLSVPFVNEMPGMASFKLGGSAIAQNAQQQSQVQLNLSAEKKVVQKDAQGKEKVTWQAMQGRAVVQPGDVIRYTLSGSNTSDRPVKNLAINQPIPAGTVYVINSATVGSNNGAKVTYSINKGQSFVENPTVEVKLPSGKVETRPAPAEAYTHVRWNFGEVINPKASVKATYQVKVR